MRTLDFDNLTRKKRFSYPEPPIEQYSTYNKVINVDTQTDVDKSTVLKFNFDLEPFEIARFSNFPINLRLRLLTKTTTGGAEASVGWISHDDRNYTILPGIEADVFFKDVDVHIDSKRMPNFLQENHIYFTRLNDIFNTEKPQYNYGPFNQTGVFGTFGASNKEIESKITSSKYLEHSTCPLLGSVNYKCRWEGCFPFTSTTRSTTSASGIAVGNPFLPSSTRISVVLKKRPDWKRYLLLKKYSVTNARQTDNSGADLTILDTLSVKFLDVSLSLECWRPKLDSQLKMYKQIPLLEYVAEIPEIM